MRICANCFKDEELIHYIESESKENGLCECCNSKVETPVLNIEELLDFFIELNSIFCEHTDGIELTKFVQSEWNIFSDENCANLILSYVSANNNSCIQPNMKVRYIPEIDTLDVVWGRMKDKIKWESRYLVDIEEELGWDPMLGYNLFSISQGDFFRTRINPDGSNEKIDISEMGHPHKEKATSGRANPQGIPYLYLSKDLETTLYEARVSFLDIVTVATFTIKEELNIVDFVGEGSLFDTDIKETVKRIILKRIISRDMSRPIRRFDSELEYIPTQHICEYIKYRTNADGIRFKSSLHNDGINLVLFNEEKLVRTSTQLRKIIDVRILSEEIIM